MDKKWKVVSCTRLFQAGVDFLEEKVNFVQRTNQQPKDILDEIVDADAIILGLQILDGETIRKCPNLKVIAKQGTGFDNVDAAVATELGIPIVITPGANIQSVAEHTMCCILTAMKNMRVQLNHAVAGDFSARNNCEAFELKGKTLGLFGMGKIGLLVADMCKAFGMEVLVYDPFIAKEKVEARGYHYAPTKEYILQNGDVFTIHIPLTKDTENLISYDEFALMKKTACLVNCARGKIVNEKALYAALKDRQIFCAALDTFEDEPTRKDDPLLALDNLIASPHVAALTKEASSRMGLMVGEGVWAVLNGQKHPHVGNPSVYSHSKWCE